MASLAGKVAIVTGASRGIGRAIALRLAHEGASVVINYGRSGDKAKEVVTAIESEGGQALAVQADLTHNADIHRLFQDTVSHFGQLNILVNNAGGGEAKPLLEVDEAHFARMFDLNVRGLLLASKEATRYFGNSGGRIINVSSSAGTDAMPNMSVYGATKAAVDSLTRSHAAELGPLNITVNAVAPGPTTSELFTASISEEAQQAMIENTPLGRLGRPEDIANVVAFLATDDAYWVTGQVIRVAGGWHP